MLLVVALSEMEPEEESIVARTRRTIKSLPDPYGHGFARTKILWNEPEKHGKKANDIG